MLIVNEFYWFSAFPLFILIIMMYFFSADKLLLLITFSTPLAINLQDFDAGVSLSLPTEPLLFGTLLLFIIKLLHENFISPKVLKHPVTIAILFNLLWMLITSLTSEFPIISLKYFLSRLWFVIPFYFFAIKLFKSTKNINIFALIYLIPLVGVIFFTIYGHATYGFDEQVGHWIMQPFYNDHTQYGAILAMFLVVFFGYLFYPKYSRTQKLAVLVGFIILFVAIVFSKSRAAWVSVAGALGVYMVVKLKINYKWVLGFTAVVIALFFTFQADILMKLEKNKQDSSDNLTEHVQSISNISSDASNLERINRWQSAIRMFEERPFWGWGPGTYQFCYAPFQYSQEKTIISTNAGDMGNAHSEYIGPLAESGVLGSLSFLVIIITIIATAMKVIIKTNNKKIKLLSLIYILSLTTYFIHGLLNNFLDSDKASVPFWGFVAIIVALDVFHHQEEKKTITENR
jgi:O-antigen ligase